MTNREYLIKCTNAYDLLCKINVNTSDECVIKLITGSYQRCRKADCNCCIAEWLNEEKEWNDEYSSNG